MKKRGLGKGLDAIFAENNAESVSVSVRSNRIGSSPEKNLTARRFPSWRILFHSTACCSPFCCGPCSAGGTA